MLAIRFNRSGRANNAFFRVVVTESSKPTGSGFIKVLGWYNPHTKDSSLNKEEILRYLNNGAKPSNSVAKLLESCKISHKAIKFVPDAPGKKKSEKKDEPKQAESTKEAEAGEEVSAETEEAKEVTEEATNSEEVPAENTDQPAEEVSEEQK